jgi:large subunit ribosomal protein L25
MSEMTIEVQQRQEIGKNANRRLRASGQVPAVVYGSGLDPATIQVEKRQIENLLRKGGGENAVFLLKLAGTDKSRHTMIREMQIDVLNGDMIHIDFQRIKMDEVVKVFVPIEVHGVAEGVKAEGGMLDHPTREVEVSCLPSSIPSQIGLDVSALNVGQHIEAGELELPEGVELLSDSDRVIVSVMAKQKVEETEEGEDGEELLSTEAEEPQVVGGESE